MALLARYRSRVLGDTVSVTRSRSDASRYDRAYFDKWYRHPTHRVKSPTELERQVRFVLHTAEWVLGRPVQTVLDVGCGEGNWQPVLARLRPTLRYDGVDPSEYAVTRYGRRRGLQLGGIGDLDALALRGQYDLVVCCGMLNYLSAGQFRNGMGHVARRVGGVAYLEVFAQGDETEGDTGWPPLKPAAWYRRALAAAGLLPIGMQCYVTNAQRRLVARMERAW